MTEPPGGSAESAPADLGADPLTSSRLEHHTEQIAAGAYPYRFERSHLAGALHEQFAHLEPASATGESVSVAGRVMLLRSFGKLVFATLQDASGRIQLLVDRRDLDAEAFARFERVDLGDWIGAHGEVITTKKGELSVKVDDFTLLQKSLRPLPDKWHGLQDIELRSRQRYVDLMVNAAARDVALTRVRVIAELRAQFVARGYVEVETPVLLSTATGALARPFHTHHQALDLDMSLRIATELFLKRLVVAGIERVFEIGRIFRNEGIDATHNPEFTMLESYEAFADYRDIMTMVEEIFAAVASAAAGSTHLTYHERDLSLEPPYRKVPMLDLVSGAVGEVVSFDRSLDELVAMARRHGIEPEATWGHGKVIDVLFEALVADTLWEPTFVMDYPKETSPLARVHRANENLTERFELFIAGSEYANAFSELNDPLDQRARFEEQARARAAGDDEAHPIDEDYLLALEYGLPPTGGLGIGVDRLVMLLTDQHHIRDVILFPTLRPAGET